MSFFGAVVTSATKSMIDVSCGTTRIAENCATDNCSTYPLFDGAPCKWLNLHLKLNLGISIKYTGETGILVAFCVRSLRFPRHTHLHESKPVLVGKRHLQESRRSRRGNLHSHKLVRAIGRFRALRVEWRKGVRWGSFRNGPDCAPFPRSARICNSLVDIVAQVNLEATIDVLALPVSKDAAKGLALYDGAAAARTTSENASRSTVRSSIVAKKSDV